MSAELDMSQYLDLFLQEGEEQISILEAETLILEQDPTDERLQVIFRAAHTLKGSSRAMGFSNFAELTHEMENVLDQLRHRTLAVTTEIADKLLACIDTLSQMRDSIADGNGDGLDCHELVAGLQALSGTQTEQVLHVETAAQTEIWPFPTLVPADMAEALAEAAKEAPVFNARFRLVHDCVMKFVRAFMAVSIAQEAGELLVCVPGQEELEEEAFETDFELVFQSTGSADEIREKFAAISEVEKFWFEPWSSAEAKPVTDSAAAKPPLTVIEPEAGKSAPAPAQASPAAAKRTETGQTVRVDVARLDSLMNLVGELVIDRTRIAQIGADLSQKYEDPHVDALSETVSHVARITSDLQDQIMKVRMLPIETVFNRFPRVVRDLAQKLGKDVKLELNGGETELDRSVIEVIGDPLLHILRNSVDHGIELPADREKAGKPKQGTVTVSARHQENHIVIEITDDGKGINPDKIKAKAVEHGLVSAEAAAKLSDKEAIQFIFHSGLSTATEVSEVSGRGVGMDIVRSNIQKVGGLIDLESTPGQGSRFALRLPLTLAIIRGLLVEIDRQVYVLPLGSVVETLLINNKEIQKINNREVVLIRGVTTPLLRTCQLFGADLNSGKETSDEIYVVIVGLAEQRLGLVVDRLIGEQEAVIKSLSRFCGDVRGVSGATILGDGNVALIVDVNGIVNLAKQ